MPCGANRFTKGFACSGQARHNGAYRDGQGLRGFPVRRLLEVTRHQNFAQAEWQLLHCPLESIEPDSIHKDGIGIRKSGWQIGQHFIGVGQRGKTALGVGAGSQEGIFQDAKDPGPEVGAGLKAGGRANSSKSGDDT
jgi:hypothetical protein